MGVSKDFALSPKMSCQWEGKSDILPRGKLTLLILESTANLESTTMFIAKEKKRNPNFLTLNPNPLELDH
jgi:hypothetical protein